VEAGANVEAKRIDGWTPLHCAGACDGYCVFVLFRGCGCVLSPLFFREWAHHCAEIAISEYLCGFCV